MKNKDVKKSLMYLSGEDFYVFCYAVLIVLDYLNCKDGRYFKDYRKLAFLIEFIKDEKLNYIITNTHDKSLNTIDREYLFSSYSAGLGRRSEILKLLFTLEKKNYVVLDKGNTRRLVDVSLNKEAVPIEFFNKEIFSQEYHNIDVFTKCVKKLSELKLDTMLDRIYVRNGISTWAI